MFNPTFANVVALLIIVTIIVTLFAVITGFIPL